MAATTLEKRVVYVLEKFDCPRGTFASLVGTTECKLSRILHGHVQMKPYMKERMAAALAFIIETQKHSDLPVCYHGFPRLEPSWVVYQKTLSPAARNGDERSAAD